jgi:hypothetical protein
MRTPRRRRPYRERGLNGRCRCNTSTGSPASSPLRFGDSFLLQQAGRPGGAGRLGEPAAGAHLHLLASFIGMGSASWRRPGNIAGSIPLRLHILSGDDVPRFLLASSSSTSWPSPQRSGDRRLFLAMRRRAVEWDKFVDLVKHVWPVVFIPLWRARLQHARHAPITRRAELQYVETARAKGLPNRRGDAHAVPMRCTRWSPIRGARPTC